MINFDLPDDLIEIGAEVIRSVLPGVEQSDLETAAMGAFMSMLSYTQDADIAFINDDGNKYVWPHGAMEPIAAYDAGLNPIKGDE